MLRFDPIDIGAGLDCGRGNLILFDWENGSADFIIPGDDAHVLRVQFEGDVIVRMLDETWLSTESDPSTWEGLVPGHFAYRVEGASFAATQSPVWDDIAGPVTHYQFVTLAGCLDVLSPVAPTARVVPARSR